MASILDILAWRNISLSVQKVETGIPDRLPPEFSTIKENVLGDRTTYVTFRGQRQTAKRAEYGSPSRVRAQRPIGEQSHTLLHFPEHVKIEQELYMRLRNPNDLLAQKQAQDIIARAGADQRTVFDNTRITAKTMMLSKGKIWFDIGGSILPTSSGAFHTVDYGIGANNLNQLNGIIDISWDDPDAPIIQHLENIRVQMRRNTGRVLKNAFYGKNVANYLFTNNTLQAYWRYNSKMQEQFAANPGAVPMGFAGLNWYPMADTFYDDANETTQPLWDDDQVTFTPEITSNVYTLYEGSILVPTVYMVGDSLQSAANTLDIVYGMGGYAIPEVDPVGVKSVYFDTFYPAWKNALDMFIAAVAF